MVWTSIEEPDNPVDDEVMKCCFELTGTTGFGRVRYPYRIGRFKVTYAQYAEFLTAIAASDPNGVFSPRMDDDDGGIDRFGAPGSFTYQAKPGREKWPVAFVDAFRAYRFANWMHNGQPVGAQDASTTEDGAYTLLGANPVDVTRNAHADVFVPSEDEWYKAAYYDPEEEVYYDWPTGTDEEPEPGAPPGGDNSCNYVLPGRACPDVDEGICSLTDVGAYVDSPSAYGTFDQCGSLVELTDTLAPAEESVIIRGTAWNFNHRDAQSEFRNDARMTCNSCPFTGFRVASRKLGPPPECGDQLDNDGDGLVDWPEDPGCEYFGDRFEDAPGLPCDDGLDNDGDGLVDWPDDPGCAGASWPVEDPPCQDGLENDIPPDQRIDFDGGASAGLPPEAQTAPDPTCEGIPWRQERDPRACGLGAELALLALPLHRLLRRARGAGGRARV